MQAEEWSQQVEIIGVEREDRPHRRRHNAVFG